MKYLLLERQPSGDEETQGFLSFRDTVLATIEQEWRPDPKRSGGESNNSCVPAGTYRLIPHTRPSGAKVLALINETLGVYYLSDDMPAQGGRFLILLHAGNSSKDVVGCIAPGLGKSGVTVTSSRLAMEKIMTYVGNDDAELTIRWIT